MSIVLLIGTMLALLLASELFTNSVEWLGHRLGLSDGTIGSVLAAVGTALPETLIPIVAIVGGGQAAHDISVGAILGAPFMLSTLAMFISGLAVAIFRGFDRQNMVVNLDRDGALNDVTWFLYLFVPLLLGAFLPSGWPRTVLAVLLLGGYAAYVRITVAHTEEERETPGALHFGRQVSPAIWLIVLQLVISLALLLGAAQLFVTAVQSVAHILGVPLLALSLLVVPVATELPEKLNSVIWLRRRKDTLALGNISGAMVFQAAIPGAIGLLFTDWRLESYSWVSSGLTLISMLTLWAWLRWGGALSARLLLGGGLLYGLYVADIVH